MARGCPPVEVYPGVFAFWDVRWRRWGGILVITGIVHGVPEGSGKGIRTGSGQVHDRYVQHVVLR